MTSVGRRLSGVLRYSSTLICGAGVMTLVSLDDNHFSIADAGVSMDDDDAIVLQEKQGRRYQITQQRSIRSCRGSA
jgi:hypothetical protein